MANLFERKGRSEDPSHRLTREITRQPLVAHLRRRRPRLLAAVLRDTLSLDANTGVGPAAPRDRSTGIRRASGETGHE